MNNNIWGMRDFDLTEKPEGLFHEEPINELKKKNKMYKRTCETNVKHHP